MFDYVEPHDLVRAECVNWAWRELIHSDEPTWRTVYDRHLGGPGVGTHERTGVTGSPDSDRRS